MSDVVFTMPGKCGDSLMQWPIPYWWAKETGKKFTLWLDENSCKMLKPLFEAQPCVESVEFRPGVENYGCGGQPWHFGMETADYAGKAVHHLGFRGFPQRQLTLETLNKSRVPINVDQDSLATEVCLETTPGEKRNRLILHGQPICVHTKTTPAFWSFISSIRGELESRFEQIVFVGSERDLEIGKRTYPDWDTFDDHGDFKVLADYVATSEACIGVGSSVVVLSGLLQIPTIRVHDPISDHTKTLWSNLSPKSINDTEVELRKSWPLWRDTHLSEVPVG